MGRIFPEGPGLLRTRPRRLLTAALVLGAAFRLAAAGFYFSTPLSPGGDDRQYYELASSLASGQGYLYHGKPSAYRAPLYPLWLAAVMTVSRSRSPGVLRLAAALLSIVGIWLAFLLGREAHSERAGAWGALLLALCPEQILLPTSLYSESFYALLVLLVALALIRWRKAPSPASASRLGAALGLSLLTRSTLAFVPLLFPPRRLKQAGCLLALAALTLAPWILRNALRFGRLIPFESGVAGPVIWYASEGYIRAPSDEAGVEPMKTMYATLPHTEWDSFALRLAARNIARHPLRYAAGCLRRMGALWTDSYTCYLLHDHQRLAGFMEARWEWVYWPDVFLRLILAALAFRGRRRGRALAALALYFNVYALGAVFARFIAPATPILCVLAGL